MKLSSSEIVFAFLILSTATINIFLCKNVDGFVQVSSVVSSRKQSMITTTTATTATTTTTTTTTRLHFSSTVPTGGREPFEIQFDLPPSNSGIQASMKIQPILSVPSSIVIVRYKIPFGLDVVPRKGYAVCTKDGPGGEQVNDILRFTSQWTLELPRGDGLATTAASFAGGLSWQCSMFDVVKAKVWEQVIQALTSNVVSRTDEVVLVFERSLDGVPPELE